VTLEWTCAIACRMGFIDPSVVVGKIDVWFTTVSIFDRYLAECDVPRDKLQLLACVSLSLATNLWEVSPAPVSDYTHLSLHSFTAEQFANQGLDVVKKLRGELWTPTCWTYTTEFCPRTCLVAVFASILWDGFSCEDPRLVLAATQALAGKPLTRDAEPVLRRCHAAVFEQSLPSVTEHSPFHGDSLPAIPALTTILRPLSRTDEPELPRATGVSRRPGAGRGSRSRRRLREQAVDLPTGPPARMRRRARSGRAVAARRVVRTPHSRDLL
jgi:hypothetical protein